MFWDFRTESKSQLEHSSSGRSTFCPEALIADLSSWTGAQPDKLFYFTLNNDPSSPAAAMTAPGKMASSEMLGVSSEGLVLWYSTGAYFSTR